MTIDLSAIADEVERRLKALPRRAAGEAPDNWERQRTIHEKALDELVASLERDVNAKISKGGSSYDVAVKIAGIRSTCTGGTEGALRNWVTAARKRLAS